MHCITSDHRGIKNVAAFSLALALAALPQQSRAANAYWDANGPAAGAGGPTPSGTWGADNFWSTSSAGTAATGAWISGDIAIFSAAADANGIFTVTLNGTQTAGGVTFEDGTLTLSSGTLFLNSGANVVANPGRSATISSVIDGAGWSKQGGGALTLSGANTFTGPLTLTGGTLRFDNNGAAGAGSIVVSPTTDVFIQNSIAATTLGNSIVLNAGNNLDVSAISGTLTLNGAISGARTLWSIGGQAANTVLLGGNSSFSGNLKVLGGTLIITANNSLGTIAGTTEITAGATLGVQGGFTYTTAEDVKLNGDGVGSAGAIRNVSGGNTFAGPIDLLTSATVGATAGSLELAGTITGPVFNITKVGTGRIIISGLGNNWNNTIISGGTLRVDTDLGTGSVTVGAGTTLAGAGNVAGAVTLSGTISPGASPDAITTGPEVWNTGASYTWEINDADFGAPGAGTGWDLIDVANGAKTLTISPMAPGAFTIDITSLDPIFNLPGQPAGDFDNTTDYDFLIANAPGGITGFAANKFTLNTVNFFNDMSPQGVFLLQTENSDKELHLLFRRAPNVTVQPVAQLNKECSVDGATFTVTATGSSTLHYQWFHGLTPVGADSPTLTISPVFSADAGLYHVVVSNPYGSDTSSDAALTVIDTIKPVLTPCPANILVSAAVPTSVTYACPTALDSCDGPVSVVCTPPSGSIFPLGTTLVTATATDSHANSQSCSFYVTICGADPAQVFVDDNYAGKLSGEPVNFPDNGAAGPHVIGCDAFATVQGGLNSVAAAGTVNVAAGSYSETVTVNKAVTLLGANAGVASCTGRGPESAINGGAASAIDIAADGVTVDGFSLSGLRGLRDLGFEGLSVSNNLVTAASVGLDLEGIVPTSPLGVTVANNCITLTSQMLSTSPTIGIELIGVSGLAPLISSNSITAAFYGYLLFDVNASTATTIQGGSITAVKQGVAVINVDPVAFSVYKATRFAVDGVTMSGFTGTHPASPGNNFHAGVYVFTGGTDASATVQGTVTNVAISGTGKISQDCAGVSCADFSTGPGARQTIAVKNSALSGNLNRGINVRGANAVVTVSRCTLSANGADPFGAGGNDGFGIIVRNNAQANVTETFITNPASQVGFSVTAVAADADTGPQGPTLTVFDCSLENNGNPAGKLASQSAGNFDASGNWWGSSVPATIAASIIGVVDYTPWLDLGTDTAPGTTGFQGDFSALHVDDSSPQTGSAGRIQEGINLIADGGLVGGNRVLDVEPGTYSEVLDYRDIWVNKPLRLVSTGGAAVTTINGPAQYMVLIDASDVTMDGFTVTDPTYSTGGFGGDGTGIYVNWMTPLSNVHVENCVVRDLGDRIAGLSCGSGPNLEIDHCTVYNINGYGTQAHVNDYNDFSVGIWVWDDGLVSASVHDNIVHDIYPRALSVGINVSYNVANAVVALNQVSLDPACTAGVRLGSSLLGGPNTVAQNTVSGASNGLLLLSPFAQTASTNVVSGSAASIFVGDSSATLLGNSASAGSGIGIWVSGATARALIEGNALVGDSVAAIKIDGGATVDAGDCTGGNVTGLGTGSGLNGSSAGGNGMTGYGFDNAAPWAVQDLNTSGQPNVLAHHNNFGAAANVKDLVLDGNDTAGANSIVRYSQSGAVYLACPGNLSGPAYQCFPSDLPAPATTLAQFLALGGVASATEGALSSIDGPPVQVGPAIITVTRTYTLTDICGGPSGNCQQTITFDDITPPLITCPPDLTDVPTDPGTCSTLAANVALGTPITQDNCGVLTVTNNAPAVFPHGTTIVTWTVVDTGGNLATCPQSVTVKDHENPTITCPADLTDVHTDPSACSTLASHILLGTPITHDNCGVLTVTNNAPAVFPHGTTIVTWTIVDTGGNVAACPQSVTVNDHENPTITCPPIVVVNNDAGQCYATGVALGTPPTGDNCAVATVTNNAPIQFPVGTNIVTWTVVDTSGNIAICHQTVAVLDSEPPIIGTLAASEIQPNVVGPVNVKNCANVTVQGTVNISVQASDQCPLSPPTINLTNGAQIATATFVNQGPPGVFNYTWAIGPTTAQGTWTATVHANDTGNSTTANFTLCVNPAQITGSVQLEGFVGTGTVPLHTRTVVLVATDGPGGGANVLKTWTLALANVSGDTFNYILTDVPAGTLGLSAKANWNLRSKRAVTLDINGQASGVNFTAAKQLRGGDLQGDNIINFFDYSILGNNFFTFNTVADITGDGQVNLDDYFILSVNWFTAGDPQ